jgi:hypothetical protein
MVRCIPGIGGGDSYDDDDDNDEDNNNGDNHITTTMTRTRTMMTASLFDTTTNLGLMHIISMMFQSLSAVSMWQGIAWMIVCPVYNYFIVADSNMHHPMVKHRQT